MGIDLIKPKNQFPPVCPLCGCLLAGWSKFRGVLEFGSQSDSKRYHEKNTFWAVLDRANGRTLSLSHPPAIGHRQQELAPFQISRLCLDVQGVGCLRFSKSVLGVRK